MKPVLEGQPLTAKFPQAMPLTWRGFKFPGVCVGLLDFKFNSSPRPELFSSPGLLLAHPWSAQPQSVPGLPSPRVSLECPTPEDLYQERVGMFEVNNFWTCFRKTGRRS